MLSGEKNIVTSRTRKGIKTLEKGILSEEQVKIISF